MSTIDASYASSRDLALLSNIFVPSYTYDPTNFTFQVQLDTYLQGTVNIGSSNTDYKFNINGNPYVQVTVSDWAKAPAIATVDMSAYRITRLGNQLQSDNTSGLPAISFYNDPTTGIYSDGPGRVGILSQSVSALMVTAGGLSNRSITSNSIGGVTLSGSQIVTGAGSNNIGGVALNAGSITTPYGSLANINGVLLDRDRLSTIFNASSYIAGVTLSSGTVGADSASLGGVSISGTRINALGPSIVGGINLGNGTITAPNETAIHRIGGVTIQGSSIVGGTLAATTVLNNSYTVVNYGGGVQFGLGRMIVNISGNGAAVPVGQFNVSMGNAPDMSAGTTAWSSSYALFGADITSATGAALGLGYDKTNGVARIVAAQPGSGALKDMVISARNLSLAVTQLTVCGAIVNLSTSPSFIGGVSLTNSLVGGVSISSGGIFTPTVSVVNTIGGVTLENRRVTAQIIDTGTNTGQSVVSRVSLDNGNINAPGTNSVIGGVTLNNGKIIPSNVTWVAIGSNAGAGGAANSVSIGTGAGNASQQQSSIAIGSNAGKTSQGASLAPGVTATGFAVAIGSEAGASNQASSAVAIGGSAGSDGQKFGSVAIGNNTAAVSQGLRSIAIGDHAANVNQSGGAVAIGTNAGRSNQGGHSIAIGASAGATSQFSNSIVLNATGADLDTTGTRNYQNTSGFFVAPVRPSTDTGNASEVGVIAWNPTTKEMFSAKNGAATLGGVAFSNETIVAGSGTSRIGGVTMSNSNVLAQNISAGKLQLSNLTSETANTNILSLNTTTNAVSYTSKYVQGVTTGGTGITVGGTAQNPTISNTGVTGITAGTGITISPAGPNATGVVTINANTNGTVTSVTSSTANITVANTTTTPVLTLSPNLNVTTIQAGTGSSSVGGVTLVNNGVVATNITATGTISGGNLVGTAISAGGTSYVGRVTLSNGAMYTTVNNQSEIGIWTAQSIGGNAYWYSVACSADGSTLIACVDGGSVYVSKNGGAWTAQSIGGNAYWKSVACSADGSTLIACAYNDFVYVSKNGGVWTQQAIGGTANWISVACSANGSTLIACVYNGSVYVSENGGELWTAQSIGGNLFWYSVASSADGSTWIACATAGFVYVSKNGGAWIQQSIGGIASWYSVACSADGSTLIACVNNGSVYVSKNGGELWTAQSIGGGNLFWYSVACSADGSTLIACATAGFVYVSKNGGAWIQQSIGGTANWRSVACSADGSTLMACVNNGSVYVLRFGVFFINKTYAWIGGLSLSGGNISNEGTTSNNIGGVTLSAGALTNVTTIQAGTGSSAIGGVTLVNNGVVATNITATGTISGGNLVGTTISAGGTSYVGGVTLVNSNVLAQNISAGKLQLSNLTSETANTNILSLNTTTGAVSYTSKYVQGITAGTGITISPAGPGATGVVTITATTGGTVSSVTSSTANITVANTTTTPVLTLNPNLNVTTIQAGAGSSAIGGVTLNAGALTNVTSVNASTPVIVGGVKTKGDTATAKMWLYPDGSAVPTQLDHSIAIGGSNAGKNQSYDAIAVGYGAGASVASTQADGAVSIGSYAGHAGQGARAIAIGYNAASAGVVNATGTPQFANSIVIDTGAATGGGCAFGAPNTYTSVAGFFVNPIRTAPDSTASVIAYTSNNEIVNVGGTIGATLGGVNFSNTRIVPQSANAQIAIGSNAGTNQQLSAIAIGGQAGQTNQTQYSVAIGYNAGNIAQGSANGYCTAIGGAAGYSGQCDYAVAIGFEAGRTDQSFGAIAIGTNAAFNGQGEYAISIGYGTQSNQRSRAIAIGCGYYSGQTYWGSNQGSNAIAIGFVSGKENQGANSIAIGAFAGHRLQKDNSIMLNATGAEINTAYQNTSGFYVAPIRDATLTLSGLPSLAYNTVTKEVVQRGFGQIIAYGSYNDGVGFKLEKGGTLSTTTATRTFTFTTALADSQFVVTFGSGQNGNNYYLTGRSSTYFSFSNNANNSSILVDFTVVY